MQDMSTAKNYVTPKISIGETVSIRLSKAAGQWFPAFVLSVGDAAISAVVFRRGTYTYVDGVHFHLDPWASRPELQADIPVWDVTELRKQVELMAADIRSLKAALEGKSDTVSGTPVRVSSLPPTEDSDEDSARRMIRAGVTDIPKIRIATGLKAARIREIIEEVADADLAKAAS